MTLKGMSKLSGNAVRQSSTLWIPQTQLQTPTCCITVCWRLRRFVWHQPLRVWTYLWPR